MLIPSARGSRTVKEEKDLYKSLGNLFHYIPWLHRDGYRYPSDEVRAIQHANANLVGVFYCCEQRASRSYRHCKSDVLSTFRLGHHELAECCAYSAA